MRSSSVDLSARDPVPSAMEVVAARRFFWSRARRLVAVGCLAYAFLCFCVFFVTGRSPAAWPSLGDYR